MSHPDWSSYIGYLYVGASFKLCMMMHSTHTTKCPINLNEIIATIANSSSRSGLRSSTTNDLYVTPRLRTKLYGLYGAQQLPVILTYVFSEFPNFLLANRHLSLVVI
jgi:hypothetical protein